MRIELSYPLKYFPCLDNMIVDKLGHPEASGAGFGQRDLVYEGRSNTKIRQLLGSLVQDYDINLNILV